MRSLLPVLVPVIVLAIIATLLLEPPYQLWLAFLVAVGVLGVELTRTLGCHRRVETRYRVEKMATVPGSSRQGWKTLQTFPDEQQAIGFMNLTAVSELGVEPQQYRVVTERVVIQ